MKYFLLTLLLLMLPMAPLTAQTPNPDTPTASSQTEEQAQVLVVVWSPDGNKLALGYENGQIKIIGIPDGKILTQMQIPTVYGQSSIYALAWSPDGNFLAGGSAHPDNTLYIWDALTGKEIFSRPDVGEDILSVAWNPDGSQIIATAAEPSNEPTDAVVVNPITYQVTPLKLPSIGDIKWSPDGRKVAMSGAFSIYIFAASTLQRFSEYPISRQSFRRGAENQPIKIIWSPDGTRFIVGMGDARIFIWRLDDPQPYLTLIGSDYQGQERFPPFINALQFTDSGQTLVSVAGDGTIRTWDLTDGSLIAEQQGFPNRAAAFNPAQMQIAFGTTPTHEAPRANLGDAQIFADIGVTILGYNPTPVKSN